MLWSDLFVDEVSASLERPLLRQKQQKMKFNKEMDTPAGRYHYRQDKSNALAMMLCKYWTLAKNYFHKLTVEKDQIKPNPRNLWLLHVQNFEKSFCQLTIALAFRT